MQISCSLIPKFNAYHSTKGHLLLSKNILIKRLKNLTMLINKIKIENIRS